LWTHQWVQWEPLELGFEGCSILLLEKMNKEDFYFILANTLFTFSTDILLQGLEDSTADIQ
jgi:hypothetical protein